MSRLPGFRHSLETRKKIGISQKGKKRRRRPIHERLLEKVNKTSTCWEWIGSKYPIGYGRIWTGKGVGYAHRVSYEIYKGPIPNDLCIDHLCRNRACVNPAHLEVVTFQENIRRRSNEYLRGNNHRNKLKAHSLRTQMLCVNKG